MPVLRVSYPPGTGKNRQEQRTGETPVLRVGCSQIIAPLVLWED
ncbi:MAG: hypothetical protein SXA11_26305 [Cyanobacteriota bacterium]|nr:hypothetical protein [Cyanobacteriota bacterium]